MTEKQVNIQNKCEKNKDKLVTCKKEERKKKVK